MESVVIHGDCLIELVNLKSNKIDSIVTDPPAGISFLGEKWDSDRGGRDAWIDWLTEVMVECYRVLKPGSHAFVWAIPRTSHWTATAIENAGFEIRDVVSHHFGSGFPKSMDVSKAIDPELETEWEGWGTALKPGSEHWVLARKPISTTVAKNVLKHRTGGLNIDGTRISTSDNLNGGAYAKDGSTRYDGDENWRYKREGGAGEYKQPTGRWPANVVFSHSSECKRLGNKKVRIPNGSGRSSTCSPVFQDRYVGGKKIQEGFGGGFADEDGNEVVDDWDCADDCPVAELDKQSGKLTSGFMGAGQQRKDSKDKGGYGGHFPDEATSADTYGDTGGASRFFAVFDAEQIDERFLYAAKSPKEERNRGMKPKPETDIPVLFASEDNDTPETNDHPTVKSISLMRWLCRLITPKGGTVLDPFCGSGSTGCAAVQEKLNFIGVENNEQYVKIARARIKKTESSLID